MFCDSEGGASRAQAILRSHPASGLRDLDREHFTLLQHDTPPPRAEFHLRHVFSS